MAMVDLLTEKLKFMKLDKCSKIDDKSVYYCLNKVTQLQELSIMFCGQLTEKALLGDTTQQQNEQGNFVAHSDDFESSQWVYQLRHIYFGGLMEMPEHAVISIIEHSPKLKTCSIPAILGITDTCLHKIANSCPSLQHINISLCNSVTSEGPIKLIEKCKMLKHVDFSGVVKLTDQVLDNLADVAEEMNGHSLKVLDVSKCSLMTEKSILRVVNKCNNLTTLRLKGISNFSDSFQDSVTKIRPYVNVTKDS